MSAVGVTRGSDLHRCHAQGRNYLVVEHQLLARLDVAARSPHRLLLPWVPVPLEVGLGAVIEQRRRVLAPAKGIRFRVTAGDVLQESTAFAGIG